MNAIDPEKKKADTDGNPPDEIQLDDEWLDDVKSRKRGDIASPDAEYLAM